MAEAPAPENIGDVYKLTNYERKGNVVYGWACQHEQYPIIWLLELQDGAVFGWGEDMMGATITLHRRNPLPDRGGIETHPYQIDPGDPLPEVFAPGHYIREELAERGWTQEHLEELLDCSHNTVTRIINDHSSITAQTAMKLAAAFKDEAIVWLELDAAWRLSKLTVGHKDT